MLVNYQINFGSKSFSMTGRKDVGSDYQILLNVFQRQMFNTTRFPHHHERLSAHYRDIVKSNLSPVIFDAGANIGASSRFFAETFSDSIVYGIEPAPDNYELLLRNMKSLKFVGINAALSEFDGRLKLNTQSHGPIAYRVDPEGDLVVSSRSILSLLNDLGDDSIPFILKIDIEGAEKELFNESPSCLNFFALIIMEPHDWMLPFNGVSRSFFNAISRSNFDFLMYGENIFLFNNEFKMDRYGDSLVK